jgi:multidrug efflux pump subunit AcrA (membrane-fusion protein)
VIFAQGDAPTWVVAGATVGAFGAAWRAAVWTARTAESGREQVKAANEQVAAARQQADAARAQLDLAKSESERERELARAADDRLLRAQLDARAPVVYARATPGGTARNRMTEPEEASRPALTAVAESQYHQSRDSLTDPVNVVRERLIVNDGELFMFALTVTIEFINCSDVPARINITASVNAEVTLPRGQDLLVPPRESRQVVWTRRLGSQLLSTQEDVERPELTTFQLDYLVRDLTHNVSDTYRFNSDLRHFRRDGARLIVEPQPPAPWTEDYAAQVDERRYERLEKKASVQAIRKALHGSGQ